MQDEFNSAFVQLLNDDRITVCHLSVYVALFFRWHQNAFNNPVSITRREIMKLAHIGSIATYHKCINELQQFGFIEYWPSYHPSLGSQIRLYARLND